MPQSVLDVATPERVAVELPIAGIGSRAMAYLIDVALLFLVGVTLYFAFTLLVPDPLEVVLALSQAARVVGLVGLFLALWVYWTAMEVFWHGQTLGKRLMRIRVVRADGSPATAAESAIRNLLRVIDFFPMCYPVGLVTMLVDARHRRVGDLVAGTVLIREEAIDLSRFETGGSELSTREIDVLTDFLRRFEQLSPTARLRVGRQLLARLGVTPPEPLDDTTLRSLLEARCAPRPRDG